MPRDITGRLQRSCTGFAGMRGMFPLQLVLLVYWRSQGFVDRGAHWPCVESGINALDGLGFVLSRWMSEKR